MWIMGCTDVNELKVPTSFKSLKLRPLHIPKPTFFTSKNSSVSPLDLAHYSGCGSEEQARKDESSNKQVALQSTRWSPTPEQLLALEELYRHGTRTPTAQQIQQITLKLRRFGKIEGKNVFYWFQNHKARDRKKQRRKMLEAQQAAQRQNSDPQKCLETKESVFTSGSRRTALQLKQTKWTPFSTCNRFPEESEVEEKGINNRPIIIKKSTEESQSQASWQLNEMSFSFPTDRDVRSSSSTVVSSSFNLEAQNCSISLMLNRVEVAERPTLELFPLSSDNLKGEGHGINCGVATGDYSSYEVVSNQDFFEFLPLKN
ncbi:hypothetical protein UlMin_040828 [Ulmus minor]